MQSRKLAIALTAMIVLCLTGCRATLRTATHDTVTVDKVRTEWRTRVDSVWRDRWHTQYVSGDTVYRVDSVTVCRYVKIGDTVFVRDSVYISQSDTETVEERKPRLVTWLKGAAAGVLLMIAAAVAGWTARKLRK